MNTIHNLPKEFEPYRDAIEKTVKPVIKITGVKDNTTLFESKIAGDPYLPKDIEHPLDEVGKPMRLLAQINFAEVPHIVGFPEKGILQFFISGADDVMGLNLDHPTQQKNFRVLFYTEIILDPSQLVQDFSYVDKNDEYFPCEHEVKLSFEVESEPVSLVDYHVEHCGFYEVLDDNAELWDLYSETFGGEGAKIGGYAHFTQEDPRSYGDYKDYNTLLLQVDSNEDLGIMWGDVGVANFFITEEDLRKKNFANVLYNWDCF
ncbi:YwqG family protein [Fredinandcohnia salidurans]|uniref:YwqG family protein n=1 Tax=Fredinandcohnia salidurans TaxID=2595041 RepID=A0ABW4MQH1_9BACI